LPINHRFHDWRKAVKYLWYQTRLLHAAAPSVLGPLVDQLDGLADALGDDHDLAVLGGLLDADPGRFGTPECVVHVKQLARLQQEELRIAAYRSGATIYAESAPVFRRRIRSYWRLAIREGPERPTGGIAALAAARSDRSGASASVDAATTVERERKFVIDAIPTDLDLSDRVEIRQGYLVADDSASVRVRDSGHHGRTLTVKAGRGAERTELEWAIGNDQFEAAWPHTTGRRVVKTRHRIPHGAHLIELDVFAEDLDGLVFAEVEFDSAEALAEFEPPAWFGREVTDDGRYTNAALALHGRPDQ
jgi:CYTH domain-containing protein